MISKFLGSFIIAIVAFGASQALANDAATESQEAVSKTVQGSAHFELHHTLVPLICTVNEGCAKSKPYWTVVVSSEGTDYELDTQFNLGSEAEPDSITLMGVTVRRGSVISVEGTVEYSGDHYVLLSQVRSVDVLRSDYSQSILANFMNWSCRGRLDDQTEILAEIWFAGSTGAGSSSTNTPIGSNVDPVNRYRVRVSGSETNGGSRKFFDIGYVDDAQVSRGADQTVYNGKNGSFSFSVAIENGVVAHDVPGVLNLTVSRAVLSQNVPMDEQVHLLCNRTR